MCVHLRARVSNFMHVHVRCVHVPMYLLNAHASLLGVQVCLCFVSCECAMCHASVLCAMCRVLCAACHMCVLRVM